MNKACFTGVPVRPSRNRFWWRRMSPRKRTACLFEKVVWPRQRGAKDPLQARVEKLERRLLRLIVAIALVVLLSLVWPWVLPQILSYFDQTAKGDSQVPSMNAEETPK
jgi:hypothetical protein